MSLKYTYRGFELTAQVLKNGGTNIIVKKGDIRLSKKITSSDTREVINETKSLIDKHYTE